MVFRDVTRDGTTRLTGAPPYIPPDYIAPDIQIFTADGTWTKPDGAVLVEIEVLGAGGAGGGSGPASASQNSHGSGGSAGGYAWSMLDADDLTATVAVDIGVGGASVAAGNGGAGSGSSFGAYVVAGGGPGGLWVGSNGTANWWLEGPAGGVATAGQLLIDGEPGGAGNGGAVFGMGGRGGSSKYGQGGRERATGASGQPLFGYAATGYGSGGGGSLSTGVTAVNRSGGAGAPGLVIVKTYFQ